jgi:vanillate O-demethylase monooxygenase subunit
LLLFRKESGEAVAMLDICPHKLAPLHLGVKVGDVVQCGYHGLEFDSAGKCVRNPQGDGRIPSEAKVRIYPLVERHGALWIWMGDPDLADPGKIADFAFLTDPDRTTLKGNHQVNCNYMMLIENLMDLGHALFLHRQTGGVSEAALAESKVEQSDDGVSDQRLYLDKPAPGLFRPYMPDQSTDYWTDIRWNAPSAILNDAGCAPAGNGRAQGALNTLGAHFLTPETQHSVHYFYAHSRNFGREDQKVDEAYRRWQRDALKAEDSRVAEAIDAMLPDALDLGVRMVMLTTDRSGMLVNRMLDSMAAAEARA